ncbi:MAG TPA: hypothetical protein GX718_04955 [Brevibacterium sp.]|nr:hypothetical protein [Brevibacterium sp.]
MLANLVGDGPVMVVAERSRSESSCGCQPWTDSVAPEIET